MAWKGYETYGEGVGIEEEGGGVGGEDMGSGGGEGGGGCGEGDVGRIVVVGEVAEENGAECRGPDGTEVGSGDGVVEVAVVGGDACLEVLGVGAAAEHFGVVVGLEHEVACLAKVEVGARGYASEVGGDRHVESGGSVGVGNGKSDVVGSVVHDFEGGDDESAGAEGNLLVDGDVVVADASGHAVAVEDSIEGAWGAPEAHVAVEAEDGVGVAGVVAVVVGEDDSFDVVEVDGVAAQFGGDVGYVDSGVDEDAAAAIADVGAIAGGSAAEGDEPDALAGLGGKDGCKGVGGGGDGCGGCLRFSGARGGGIDEVEETGVLKGVE